MAARAGLPPHGSFLPPEVRARINHRLWFDDTGPSWMALYSGWLRKSNNPGWRRTRPHLTNWYTILINRFGGRNGNAGCAVGAEACTQNSLGGSGQRWRSSTIYLCPGRVRRCLGRSRLGPRIRTAAYGIWHPTSRRSVSHHRTGASRDLCEPPSSGAAAGSVLSRGLQRGRGDGSRDSHSVTRSGRGGGRG